ncbi:Gfa-like protein [Chondromyces apiculatus DSM 436]|uniref:Gfa-like protein n=1 Tax=Chondromyces apiculatus DSM 436 TaxID=1192034 RepID=A0A017T0A1_9BACT|nr:GFA family protein [Chondromyces apiculatus]EYF02633.1 Gfa-like protein [Chondromyces apiculatus DSM 436]
MTFKVTRDPSSVHWCHCSMCRRATGAASAVLVWVSRSGVDWEGVPARYRSSNVAERGFCERCGTPLFLDYERSAELAMMVGAFDNPRMLRPTHHYGVESMLPWDERHDVLPRQETDLGDPMLQGLVPTPPRAPR